MLSVSVAAFLVLAVTGAAVFAKFSWKGLIISGVVLEVLGFVLLGLPGAAFLESLDPVMQRAGFGPIPADGAWPAAIMMSVVWPLALVPAYLAARAMKSGNGQRGLVAFAVLSMTCFVLGALVYAMVS